LDENKNITKMKNNDNFNENSTNILLNNMYWKNNEVLFLTDAIEHEPWPKNIQEAFDGKNKEEFF
jgi:hypothetical protein